MAKKNRNREVILKMDKHYTKTPDALIGLHKYLTKEQRKLYLPCLGLYVLMMNSSEKFNPSGRFTASTFGISRETLALALWLLVQKNVLKHVGVDESKRGVYHFVPVDEWKLDAEVKEKPKKTVQKNKDLEHDRLDFEGEMHRIQQEKYGTSMKHLIFCIMHEYGGKIPSAKVPRTKAIFSFIQTLEESGYPKEEIISKFTLDLLLKYCVHQGPLEPAIRESWTKSTLENIYSCFKLFPWKETQTDSEPISV